jgi:hypothetical protein
VNQGNHIRRPLRLMAVSLPSANKSTSHPPISPRPRATTNAGQSKSSMLHLTRKLREAKHLPLMRFLLVHPRKLVSDMMVPPKFHQPMDINRRRARSRAGQLRLECPQQLVQNKSRKGQSPTTPLLVLCLSHPELVHRLVVHLVAGHGCLQEETPMASLPWPPLPKQTSKDAFPNPKESNTQYRHRMPSPSQLNMVSSPQSVNQAHNECSQSSWDLLARPERVGTDGRIPSLRPSDGCFWDVKRPIPKILRSR